MANAFGIAGDWATVEALLPSHWREIATKHGLSCSGLPPQLGTKVTDLAVPLRLLLYRVATNSSLKTAAAAAFAGEVIDFSPVAAHLWERKLGPFVASLVASMTGTEREFAAERWAGYDIIAVDASAVSRPGAEGTTARVHFALHLQTLRPVYVEVTDDKGGETFRRFAAAPGELWLGDRAYANPPGIAAVKDEGGEVLVRFNRGSLPLYDARNERVNVQAKLDKLRRRGRAREWAVWVHPDKKEPIRGRLIAVRLPPQQAKEARERLRREQGKDVTAESLAMAEFVVLFTTVPPDRLTTERVLELYGLRWQVELHIKREKSIAGLDKLPNRREDTVYTWICLKMLLTQLARKMTTPTHSAISPSGHWAPLLSTDAPCGPQPRGRRPRESGKPEPTSGRGALAGHDLRVASPLRSASPC